jgi:large subunit ribosomal protein L22
MPNRKKEAADKRKAERQLTTKASAELNNTPTSPRKMRLVVDLVRGKNVETATVILENSTKHAARTVMHALKSAVSNYMNKNKERRQIDEKQLYIKEVIVEQGITIKRMMPAPMGRAYRVRKRSNHLFIVVDEKVGK